MVSAVHNVVVVLGFACPAAAAVLKQAVLQQDDVQCNVQLILSAKSLRAFILLHSRLAYRCMLALAQPCRMSTHKIILHESVKLEH